jgi:hypothetical protein
VAAPSQQLTHYIPQNLAQHHGLPHEIRTSGSKSFGGWSLDNYLALAKCSILSGAPRVAGVAPGGGIVAILVAAIMVITRMVGKSV